jgi:hypothetical protein
MKVVILALMNENNEKTTDNLFEFMARFSYFINAIVDGKQSIRKPL